MQFGSAPAAGRPAMAFHARDVPAAVRGAFARQVTNLIPTCALASMLPCGTDPERAALTVPIFLGFGELEMCPDVHGTVRRYRSASDITLMVLAGSGHCHNQAGRRLQLWARLLAWARSAPLRAA